MELETRNKGVEKEWEEMKERVSRNMGKEMKKKRRKEKKGW